MEKISGIYKIINKINGKYYVGSSIDILDPGKGRFYNHKRLLNNKKHPNLHLQRAWNKYGEENFEFVIIERVSPELLQDREQDYLNLCKINPDNNYNISYDAKVFARGIKLSKKTCKRMSLSKLGSKNHYYGRKHSNEVRLKISANTKIYTPRGREHPNYIDEELNFEHINGDCFTGTRREFYTLVGNSSNAYSLINGSRKICKGWKLIKQ